MARFQGVLIAVVSAACVAHSLAQGDAKPTPLRPNRPGAAARMDSPEFENVRKAIEALTPEQRKRFQENFARWATLSPDEKRALRDQNELRRKRIKDEVEGVMNSTGLQLSEEQRVQFARRYIEERRKLEEQIRKDTEEKREAGVNGIVAKLKQEFSGGDAAPANPATTENGAAPTAKP